MAAATTASAAARAGSPGYFCSTGNGTWSIASNQQYSQAQAFLGSAGIGYMSKGGGDGFGLQSVVLLPRSSVGVAVGLASSTGTLPSILFTIDAGLTWQARAGKGGHAAAAQMTSRFPHDDRLRTAAGMPVSPFHLIVISTDRVSCPSFRPRTQTVTGFGIPPSRSIISPSGLVVSSTNLPSPPDLASVFCVNQNNGPCFAAGGYFPVRTTTLLPRSLPRTRPPKAANPPDTPRSRGPHPMCGRSLRRRVIVVA